MRIIIYILLLLSFACTHELESSYTSGSKQILKGMTEDEKIMSKIMETYKNLKSYQDKGTYYQKFTTNRGSMSEEIKGKITTYYQNDELKLDIQTQNSRLGIEWHELLKEGGKANPILQTSDKPPMYANGVQREIRHRYNHKQEVSDIFAVVVVGTFTPVAGVFLTQKSLFYHRKDGKKWERLSDSTYQGKNCYRFGVINTRDTTSNTIGLKDVKKALKESDTLFSKDTKRSIDEIIKEGFTIPETVKSTGYDVVYWFQKDTYLLVKMETFLDFLDTDDLETVVTSETVVTFDPIINQKIPKDKFTWSERDKPKK